MLLRMNVLRPVRSRRLRVHPRKKGTLLSGSVDTHSGEVVIEISVAIRFC